MVTSQTNRKQNVLGIEELEPRRLLAAGALDTSFSTDGKVTVDFGTNLATPQTIKSSDVVVQADGKTVVAGYFGRSDLKGQVDFAVIRFNIDGTLDQTFGGSDHKGIALIHPGKKGTASIASSVALQPDGKILVLGSAEVDHNLATDTSDLAVVRLLPNGTPDSSFDADGIRTIEFNGTMFSNEIAVQSDGKIVVSGSELTSGGFKFAIARLKPNGSLDSTFNNGGRKTISVSDAGFATAFALDLAGNMLIGGSSAGGMSIVRITPSGALDSTFDGDGKLVLPITGAPNATAEAFLPQSDGKIVVIGNVNISNPLHGRMLRLQNNGTLDFGFGGNGNGIVALPVMLRGDEVVRSSGGGLIVGGNNGKMILTGYSADGVLNTQFGNGGTVVTDFGDGVAGVSGLAKGPGRRIVASGGPTAHTARFLDTGANVVSIGALDSSTTEGSTDTATLFIGRSERLPTPTRIFLNIGGTATFSRTFGSDYQMSGILFTKDGQPFVDIPANETFVLPKIAAIDDSSIEGPESITFSIVPSNIYEIGTPSLGKVNIGDNDGGTVASLNGVNDAFVRNGTSVNTNFGSDPTLQVKTSTTDGNTRLSYIKFDISSLSNITTAKLKLMGNLTDTQNPSIAVDLFPVADNTWLGSTITFNIKPAPGATALGRINVTGTTQALYQFDITNYIKQEKALGHNLVSFQLRGPNATGALASFVSGNGGANQPKLEVVSSSSSVGVFSVNTPPTNLHAGVETQVNVKWTVPSGGWRQLNWVKLLVRDLDDPTTFVEFKYDEAKHDGFYPIVQPGVNTIPAGLNLTNCKITAAGPAALTMTATFAFRFYDSGKGHRFALEVSAQNDAGKQDTYSPIGTIAVF